MSKKYLSFKNIAKKIDTVAIAGNYRKVKPIVVPRIYNMINEDNLDINELIKTFAYHYRFVTPLLYIYLLQDKELINFVLKRYTKKINPIISAIDNFIEYDLLRMLYNELWDKGITIDWLLPLIYHFSNIEFLQEENSAMRKINITRFLINQTQYYKHKKKFINVLKSKITEFYQEREKFIYSKLSSDISQTISMIDELEENATNHILNIKNELLNLKNKLKEIK